MTKPLVVVGAGGHGRELLDIAEAMNAVEPTWEILGVLDDSAAAAGSTPLLDARGYRVVGGFDALADLGAQYVIGIGSPQVRRRMAEQADEWGATAAVLVHPEATIGSAVTLSPGCILASGAVITTNVSLGPHSHLNIKASLSHDCVVGSYVTLNPGSTVCGTVTIGDGATLGANAVVRQGQTIGAWSYVGAGAAVVSDVPEGVTVVGVPARLLG